MRSMEVNCITMSGPLPHHALITHIGHSRLKWRLDVAQAIRCMDLALERYYVVDPLRRQCVYLSIVKEHGHAPYLRGRTERGEWGDHLLQLPRCSPDCVAPARKPRLCCTCAAR